VEKLNTYEITQGKDYTMSRRISAENLQQVQCVTVGCQAPSKKMISQDKSFTCKNNFQTQKLLKTLDQRLTTSEEDLKPFWTDYCAEISSHLLSPTEIGSAVLDTSCSNILSKQTVDNSWFSTMIRQVPNKNLPKIYLASYMSSAVKCMDLDVTLTKSKRIRVYPTAHQRQLFKCWFGVQRYVYNKTVEYLNWIKGPRPHWTVVAMFILFDLPDWCRSTPYQIKKIAVKDACDALTTNKFKVKQAGGKFKLHFKSRKDHHQSCFIPKSAISDKGIYYTLSGNLHFSEQLPENIKDSRLVKHNGRYYLTVPYKITTIRSENQGRIAAIDPGVRSFISFFSTTGMFGHIGKHDIGRIQRLCEYLDKLTGKMSKAKSNQRQRLKKASQRLRWKIKDLVDELHWKTAKFLVNNFDVILLPRFETAKMSKRATRKIYKTSVRQMLTWSHYRFAERLKYKAAEYGKTVLRVSEAFTSKTNSWTGEIIENLGAKKFITVSKNRIDRDINGARNILLRALGDAPIILKKGEWCIC